MTRVLYLANLSGMSGGTKRAYEICKRIKAYGVEYVPITILTEHPKRSALNERFVIVRDIKFGHFHVPILSKAVTEVMRIAVKEGVEAIISAHELPTYIFTAYLGSKILRVPWSTVLQLPPKFLRIMFGKIVYPNLFKSTIVMSVSYSIAQELYLLSEELKKHIYVFKIPLGIDPIIGTVSPAKEGFDAIFFARLTKEKGLFDIPYIWRKVVKKIPDAKLAVAGSGNPRDIYVFKVLVKNLVLTKNITYLGYLPKEQLYSILKASKALIYPSYLDSFSLVVLEALAAGVPVIAYSIPAIKYAYYATRAVQKVMVGNVDEMAEKAIELLQSDEVRKELSKDAVEFTSRYTWDKATHEEAEIVKRIVEDRIKSL